MSAWSTQRTSGLSTPIPNATVAATIRAEPSRNSIIARRLAPAPSPAWYSVTRSPAAKSVSRAASAPAWVPA